MPQVARTATGVPRLPAFGRLGGRRIGAVAKWLGAHHAVTALIVYVAAVVLIERRAVLHLESVCACNGSADPAAYMWALAWWPHAIFHGLNPLFTHEIWVPGGFDLARAASVPAAALAAAPITAIAGPVAAYNVLSLLAPVLGAWFAYRLCLYVTKAPAASILGGYLFGFSSYELGHLLGTLNLVFTFAAPVVALLTLMRLDGAIGPRRYFALMAVVLIVQLLLSTEILLTLTCMGAVALAAGFVLGGPEARRAIAGLIPPLTGAYALMVVVCSPFLYYALFVGVPYSTGWGAQFPTDSLAYLVPTSFTWLGGHRFVSVSSSFLGNLAENGAYVGLPIVLIVAAFAVERFRTRAAKIMLAVLAVAVLWSLGDRLYIAGHPTIRLPWSLFGRLPLLNQLLPNRIAVYVALACAVIVACWLSGPGTGSPWRWALSLLAVVFLVPNTGVQYMGTTATAFHARISEPSFFGDVYRRYLHPGEIVLPIPYGPAGRSMLWQARTGMYFRMASGNIAIQPSSYASDPIVVQLLANTPAPGAPAELRSFIVRRRVTAAVVDFRQAGAWPRVLSRLGLQPLSVGGVLLYRIPAGWERSAATARGAPA